MPEFFAFSFSGKGTRVSQDPAGCFNLNGR